MNIEAIIKVREVLDEIVDGLRSLLLSRQGNLDDLPNCSVNWISLEMRRVVRISLLLLQDQARGLQWAIQGHMRRILDSLIVVIIERLVQVPLHVIFHDLRVLSFLELGRSRAVSLLICILWVKARSRCSLAKDAFRVLFLVSFVKVAELAHVIFELLLGSLVD